MVNITIDNHTIAVPSGTTIMEAAASIHIPIPKLCYLKDINEIGACRVCVVEIEGQDEDIFIPESDTGTAMHQDKVRIIIRDDKKE